MRRTPRFRAARAIPAAAATRFPSAERIAGGPDLPRRRTGGTAALNRSQNILLGGVEDPVPDGDAPGI
jgi:hypothetical protein